MTSVLALLFFFSQEMAGDVFWKLADAGPSAPDVTAILGDDSRTLAFAASGVFEYRLGTWARVVLSSPQGKREVPGPVFFAGGTFYALESSGGSSSPYERTLYRLSSNAWQELATFTPSGGEITHDASFLYAVSGRFDECADALSGTCATDAPARLFTISLVDGSRRDGPLLPTCGGRLVAAGGTVYFIALTPTCGGPSARRVRTLAGTPVYRLDGGAWMGLSPLAEYLDFFSLFGTPRGLWIVVPGTVTQPAVRLLNSSGLSPAMLLPYRGSPAAVAPVEWGSEILYVTDAPAGNLYHLQGNAFVPFAPLPPMQLPYGRHVEVYSAGSRLFATADGYDPQVLSGGLWTATPGIDGTAGADTYFVSPSSAFASRGGTFWKRDTSGWTRLPTPPIGTQRYEGVVWQDRPVLIDQVPPGRLLTYSETSGTWETFVTMGIVETLFASGTTLCMATASQVGCLKDGSWTFAPLPAVPASSCCGAPWLRDLGGSVVVFWYGGPYLFAGDSLQPLFTDLPAGLGAGDVASAGGRVYLLVTEFPPSPGSVPRLVVAAEPGYPAILTTRENLLYSFNGPTWLSVTLGRLFVSTPHPMMAVMLCEGQVRLARGSAAISYMDPSGLFASTGSNDLWRRGALLLPVSRVRKTLPAVVDTLGQGGVHFRTSLAVANFSPSRPALAHVIPVAHPEAALDVSLPPMTQSRILDPLPGFVGPVAIDFDGLDDEREAWASARVFSAAGAGTAGTSLDAVDPGSSSGYTYVLPPAPEPGTRSHVAIANAGDGAGFPLLEVLGTPLPPGELRQRDLSADETSRALVVSAGNDVFPSDDLLGYAVRNDGATNDGTVVPMEPPDSEIARRVRFLPAVVTLASDAASYRTQLRLARNDLHILTAGPLPFHVLYRSASISGEFDVEVDYADTTDIPDAAAWLAANGVAVDPAHVDGTLTFTSDRPEGAADLLVTAAVFARPTGLGGEYGVSVPLVSEGRWASTSAVVPGLLENGAFRSNVALANPEPPGGPATTLSVTLHRASDGSVAGALPPVTLKPGERLQFNRIARLAGIAGTFDGWAAVSRTGGAGRFVAYGVLNDETTSDGTLLSMTRVE